MATTLTLNAAIAPAAATCVSCGEPSLTNPCADCAPGYFGTAKVCHYCGDPTNRRRQRYPGLGLIRVCTDCRATAASDSRRHANRRTI